MRDCPCEMVDFNRCPYQPVRHSVIKITTRVCVCLKNVDQVFTSLVGLSCLLCNCSWLTVCIVVVVLWVCYLMCICCTVSVLFLFFYFR